MEIKRYCGSTQSGAVARAAAELADGGERRVRNDLEARAIEADAGHRRQIDQWKYLRTKPKRSTRSIDERESFCRA